MNVAIIGATGYSGLELIRLLHKHPRVNIHSIYTSSQQGEAICDVYPHLKKLINYTLEDIQIKEIKKSCDLVFTATPTGVSTKVVPPLLEAGLKVIDLSGDFRLKDNALYEQWYGMKQDHTNILQEAVYGLTEWSRHALSQAHFVANPGCFPTAVLLGLAPLVQHDMIEKHSIIIDAKTGVSGAGKNPSAVTHFSETNENIKIYRVNEHQHTPEIEQMLSIWNEEIKPVTFSTHLVPMTRGIMATMYVQVKDKRSASELLNIYQQAYEHSYFVRVRENGTLPTTKDVYGSNFCDIALTYDERTNRITIVSVIDNLVKGAAGQAVQNMNLMLGFDEKDGLDVIPIYP